MVTDLHLDPTPPVDGDGAVLTTLRTESLTERVFDAIRSAIVTKSFPPGTRLTEAALATQLDVSKTPVREAMLRLRAIGLIEDDGRRGGRVIRPSPARLRETYDLREALEVFAARAAADQATSVQRRTILEAAARSLEGADANDLNEFSRWDSVFHARITAVAANQRVTELLDGAFSLIVALRTRDTPDQDVSIECGHAHVAIATAIEADDAEGAERHMRQHIHHVKGFVIEALEAQQAIDDERRSL